MQKADRGGGFLVGEHLGVGEAAVVVDADVDVLPANRGVTLAGPTRDCAIVARRATADAFAGTALDPAELLDIDMESSPGRDRS